MAFTDFYCRGFAHTVRLVVFSNTSIHRPVFVFETALLFTESCHVHGRRNLALSKPADSISHRKALGSVSFATQPYLCCVAAWAAKWQDLWEDSINHRRISDAEPQLQAWPQASIQTSEPFTCAAVRRRDVHHTQQSFCSKTLSCSLKNIICNLSILTSSHSTEEKWLIWQLSGHQLKVEAGLEIVTVSLRDHSLSVKVMTN